MTLILAGLGLGHWVHPWFAETFLGPGILGVGVTAVMALGVSRAAPVDEEDASTSASGEAVKERGS
ncbi:hypothetical protein [Kocuria sp. SM24M-10]|uniref:hypothetical protein n=1 Tax=Kocuria sp. SM24M-10 TaxID=1660349 RepID=UPI00128DF13A|nr:hypothetical protein [Kocuria sp. SM24M-10]